MPPIVAMLTDFGIRDHYVGAMKGAVLSVCREATLVDISHDIPPQDILTGALELAAACRYFPAGTIFVVVVDPGVGSARRAIAVEAEGYRFVAPDNGVLTLALRDARPERLVELTNPGFAHPWVSRTFEGRDRFAPAAGWLARGTPLAELGRPLDDYQRLEVPVPRHDDDSLHGVVLRVDRFGNLTTNIDRRLAEQFAAGRPLSIAIAGHVVLGIVTTYADAEEGAVCALFGSSEQLEIAVRGGSAAERLQARRGASVLLVRA
jgi:S-adenosylmethionine hydrolase